MIKDFCIFISGIQLDFWLNPPMHDCHFSYKQKFLLNKNTVANSVIPLFFKGKILSFLGQTKYLGEICFCSLHSTKFLEFLAFGFYSCPNNTSHALAISVILPVGFLGKFFCPYFFHQKQIWWSFYSTVNSTNFSKFLENWGEKKKKKKTLTTYFSTT